MSKEYSKESIQVLSDLEHMKIRRQMYIGEGYDPRTLLSEIFDNAMDEVQGGFSPEIIVKIDTKTNEYTVRDYGRGIPHGKKELEGGIQKEIIAVLLTKANSGGKFDNESYSFSAGLHGLGLTITNALSNYIEIISYRKGKFVRGYAESSENVDVTYGKSDEPDGTLVRFQPNPSMFHTEKVPIDFIKERCRTASALGFRAKLIIDDVETPTNATIFDLIKEEDENINKYADFEPFEIISSTKEKMKVGIRYTSDTKDKYLGYTNLLINYLGGTHVNELSKAISAAWISFLGSHKNLKPTIDLKDSDYRVGLRGICAVFIAHPEFSSQTKEKLVVNKSYFEELMTKFQKQFVKYLEDNIVLAQQLLKRFEEYRMAQNALLSRKEISSIIKINEDSSDNIRRRSVVSKLIECTSKKRENTELFLVEGDSACLKWDTKIRLANDTEATIKEVCERVNSGETIYVYGKAPKGTAYHGPNIYKVLGGGITRKNALLYRVYIDNGTYVDCTADHKFMLVDRSFKEAKDLTPNDSLSIMTYHMDKFRAHTDVNKEYIYRNIYQKYINANVPEGYIIHHKDFNHYNNYPNNLILLSNSEHTTLHNQYNEQWKAHIGNATHLTEYWESEEHRQLQSQKTSEYFATAENRIKTSIATKLGMQKITKEQHKKRLNLQTYNVSLAYYKDLIHYRKLLTFESLFDKDKFREQKRLDNHIKASGMYLYPQKFMEKYNIIDMNEFEELIKNANHRIVKVECLNIHENVYDIEVDEVHNFCLANDVIVHNCGPYLYSRNKENQAILPLRGKIKNITNVPLKEAIKNNEICDIANAIGAGIGAGCDASKSRYDKIILSADADPDGLQINCLLLTLFVNMFPDIVRSGRLFITVPPLYCWGTSEKDYGWCNNPEEIPKNVKNMHRFKGLGEMNNDQLEFFLVNPQTRNLIQVEFPSDLDEFNRIMGTSEGKNNLYKDLGIII